ncbi:MAG: recombinase family protein [Eubacterium sp.]|nr:recombinase family protein [Eubacterium sp.]
MARKSRRNNIISMEGYLDNKSTVDSPLPKERFPTAIYARLSVENNGYDNDVSIESQVAYIHRYILDHPEYELVDTYIDNGVSGMSFERQGFKRLLDDLRKGRVTCVIVKDLSRFGRNYLETGLYIENVFPKLGVKLVAINDNFDSSREEDRNSLSVPIKNMINEMYAKDQSKKQIASNRARKYNRFAKPRGNDPYGYRYDKELRKYVPDDRYARYVKLIFLWMSLGTSAKVVAERLTVLGAPVPGNVTGERNLDDYGSKWKASKVYNIVKNPVYTGDTVLGRFERDKLGGKSVEVPFDRWVIHKNTHEPLTPREDYWKIRNMIKENDKDKKRGRDMDIKDRANCQDDFKGLVYCGDCSHVMYFNRFSCKGADGQYTNKEYICSPQEYNEKSCGKKVSADYLSIIVNEQLSNYIQLMCDRADVIRKLSTYSLKSDDGSVNHKINSLVIRIKDNKARSLKLYEDYVNGIIDKNDYQLFKDKYSVEELEEKLEALKAEKDERDRKMESFLSLFDDIKEKLSDGKYGRELYQSLIDKIIVYDNDRLEILFKYEEEYASLLEQCE